MHGTFSLNRGTRKEMIFRETPGIQGDPSWPDSKAHVLPLPCPVAHLARRPESEDIYFSILQVTFAAQKARATWIFNHTH